MYIIYGAGRDFVNLVNKEKDLVNGAHCIVDTYPEQYPDGVCGYRIESNGILEEMTEADQVCIVSTKFYTEIANLVKARNPQVSIISITAVRWKNYQPILKKQMKTMEEYHSDFDGRIASWVEAALSEEVGFWNETIQEFKKTNHERLQTREFDYSYTDDQLLFRETDRILDVGSGPVPKFGNLLHGKPISYIPVDPLAYQYERLCRRYQVTPPVTPAFAIMELLTCFYEENSMDYVIVHNALDHSIDIKYALLECLAVVKPGGYLLMQHMEAEGWHEGYCGLHKWNITELDGQLLLFNDEDKKINVNALIGDFCDIEIKRKCRQAEGRDRMIVKIKKERDMPSSLLDTCGTKKQCGAVISRLFERLTSEIMQR